MLSVMKMISSAIATKNFYKIQFSFLSPSEVLIFFCLALFVFQNCQAVSWTNSNHQGIVLSK